MSGATEGRRIRLLLVDDSPLVLAMLKRMVATCAEIEVVGTAGDGRAALELIDTLRPQVICTDLEMPRMDGLELTREVMRRFPTPILVFSAHVGRESGKAYPVLEAGALDLLPKPLSSAPQELSRVSAELIAKVKVLSGVLVFSRRRASTTEGAEPVCPAPRTSAQPSKSDLASHRPTGPARGVVIGASTGGPLVLKTILQELPASFPVPILCVQHISEGFLAGLVEWLTPYCRVSLSIAQGGETPSPGTVWFPAEGKHLDLDSKGRLLCSSLPTVDGHRPSITTSMTAAARYWGAEAVGVLLTGMGSDGSAGLAAISSRGGLTIAQSEATCTIFGMPRHAIERGAVRMVLGPAEIAGVLTRLRASVGTVGTE